MNNVSVAWQRRFADTKADNLYHVGGLDVTDYIRQLVRASGFVETNEERASLFLGEGRGEARAIGQELNRIGGFLLMQGVFEAMQDDLLSSVACRELELAWDGIGQWLG